MGEGDAGEALESPGGDAAGPGVPRWSPATCPSASTVTMSGTVAFAKYVVTVAFTYGAASLIATSPTPANAPNWPSSWLHSWVSAAAGAALRIVASSMASAAAMSPPARASTKARPTAAAGDADCDEPGPADGDADASGDAGTAGVAEPDDGPASPDPQAASTSDATARSRVLRITMRT